MLRDVFIAERLVTRSESVTRSKPMKGEANRRNIKVVLLKLKKMKITAMILGYLQSTVHYLHQEEMMTIHGMSIHAHPRT